ncbi:pyruvate, water dikinase regulatory protein [Kocuria sp. CPCC 205268]|uniref:pyruvate, water dikinase regulatory protein n=1 Tax=Kocuria oxytropis TaxID=3058913 RepID=UPI0034D77172
MTDTCPVAFFLSDSTGITAETLGNTLITQFPHQRFERHTVPFIITGERARQVAARIDAVAATGRMPVVFSTVVDPDIRGILATSQGFFVDLFGTHLPQLESALHATANRQPGRAHGLVDAIRYRSRMAAVEYAMEHDDGQSVRALEQAQLILIAPSRCGKTPTSMYLALQHGVRVANFPLVDEDFERRALPAPVAPHRAKCFGLTSQPLRLSQIRQERRPGATYSSLAQCSWELRNAEEMYALNGVPHLDSASMSVEEISATVLDRMELEELGHEPAGRRR